ncbi:YceI family protein [Acuticoccus sp.]|uniref:YceI family protein n=1 Tax=Acuticoccus sp. TaxID=1904378 RepID=UPI003B52940F
MRLALAAATSLALAFPAAAQSIDVPSGTYTIDQEHASVVWKISHLGFSDYTGMFGRDAIDGTIELDAENVANSTMTVTINGQEVRTLHPGEKDFNAEIESAQFMNTAEFPEITFETTAIEVTGETTANVTGDLTVAGTTRPVTLETTLNRAAAHPMSGTPTLGITATGTIMRSEFGNEGLLGPIGDEVTIEIQAEFQHQG